MKEEKSMNKTITEIKDALVSISNSLSILVEDTKANYEVRKANLEMFNHLEGTLKVLKEDPFGLKERNY